MDYQSLPPRDLRAEVELLYADYAETLNDEAFEAWPPFFTERAFYQITSRENFERNLPIGLMRCESRGMLEDRVVAIRQTAYYGPRSIRRMVSGVRVHGWSNAESQTQARNQQHDLAQDRTHDLARHPASDPSHHPAPRPAHHASPPILRATASYLAVETLPDELTRVFNAGKYIDELVVEEGRLRFARRICVYDTLLIPNTLVYPL